MDRGPALALRTGALAALVCLLWAGPAAAAAQEWDPGAAVLAYTAALNSHDLERALALFDEYGSAADSAGRHFEGRAGLTEFLLASGFANPTATITTVGLRVAGNRAIWTYACSCDSAATEVRLVLNRNRISVFALTAQPHPPPRPRNSAPLPWLVGLGLAATILAVGLQVGSRHGRTDWPTPRPSQGRLIAALALYRPGGAVCDRDELPAAAITSFSDSDDSAAPCSR